MEKKKKRLAIVSSYNELCGNATYAEVLRKGLEKYYTVDVIPLDVKLLNATHKKFIKFGNKHILEISEKLKQYDCVNIQFEAGLFGVFRRDIFRRVKRLVNASKNLVFTMHRVDFLQARLERSSIKFLLKGQLKSFFKYLISSQKYNYYAKMYDQILNYLVESNAKILLHTRRDAQLIKQYKNYNKVYDFPICFLTPQQVDAYRLSIDQPKFKRSYGLPSDAVVIGIFGFVSDYKGIDVAIKAMNYLPGNYYLLIFGGQHPSSIRANEKIAPYYAELTKLIDKMTGSGHGVSFYQKIKFLSGLDDESFISALCHCDATILPYIETNQGGSGIASLTLETRARSVFSYNYSFMELSRYAKDAFPMATIGNALEFAQKINALVESPNHVYAEALASYHQKYNLDTNVDFYHQLFEKINP